MKRTLLILGGLLLVLSGLGFAGYRKATWALGAPVPGDRSPHDVIIPPRTTVPGIARQLQQEGLIRDERAFRVAARYLKVDHRLQAGGYRFTRAEGTLRLLRKLAAGEVYVRKLTLPEGLTIPEIAARIEDAGCGNARVFRQLALGLRPFGDRPKWAPSGSLEGYSFPETYQVPLGMLEADLLRLFLDRFERVVVRGMAKELAAQSLSLPEVVTLASIVEREAKLPKEQPLMAAAFLNRLRLGRRLESCATVQYALPHRKEKLLYDDLEVASPFNTYLHDGLPPGPIGSPGESAIEAVLHPAESDVLYFVARPDGSHVFSQTLQQHNTAKAAIKAAAQRQQTQP